MKAAAKRVLLFGLALLGAAAVSATTTEQAYLQTCRKDPGIPIPIEVVSPSVGVEYLGATVSLEFVVDQSGTPANVSVTSSPDQTLGEAVAAAVKKWKFKPAERNGVPVARRVFLPVKVVDLSLSGDTFAAN